MVASRDATSGYLSNLSLFEEGLTGVAAQPAWKQLRRKAAERFAALGFPTTKDEEWRFTNVGPLTNLPFVPGPLIAECEMPSDEQPGVSSFPIPHSAGTFLMFENGHRPILCKRGNLLQDDIIVCGLAEALERYPDLVQPHLAQHADYQHDAFAALNTAFLHDGAFVFIPSGIVVEEPICLVFSSLRAGKPYVWHRRCLIVAGAGCEAQIVESYDGSAGVYFTNAVTEVVVGENAHIDHYRLQKESETAFHIATVKVNQARGSRFTSHHINQGSALARTSLNVMLDTEDCECTLNGLYLADGDRLVDNHTRIDHARPHCASHELYKGILSDQAHGVFNGTIFVHPDAQKTDAKQTSQTLLLSDDAVIDAKPELQIFADDVKCTHGASIGQLDQEAVFYLQSRGIDRDSARQLLTFAFANDVIGRIRIDPLRGQLEKELFAPGP